MRKRKQRAYLRNYARLREGRMHHKDWRFYLNTFPFEQGMREVVHVLNRLRIATEVR